MSYYGFYGLPIQVQDNLDGTWLMLKELHYLSKNHVQFTIPVGFRTDFGSVPNVVDWIIPGSASIADPSYLLHDLLYHLHRIGQWPHSRAYADRLLLEALEVCGVGYAKRWTIYLAVRAGGWVAWNKAA